MIAPKSWKHMPSGKGVDLAAPTPEGVDFNDIAICLSLQCRFGGCVRDFNTFYSVAQHSVLVATLVPHECRLRALLHDAHEAYTGDFCSPLKWCFDEHSPAASAALKDIQHSWDSVIWIAAGLPPYGVAEKSIIKEADTMALAIERRDLLNPPADDMTRAAWAWLPEPPANVRVVPASAQVAHKLFLDVFHHYVWPAVWSGTA